MLPVPTHAWRLQHATTKNTQPPNVVEMHTYTQDMQGTNKNAISWTRANKFDAVSDDLLISIFVFIASTAKSPADLINPMLTCKRFCAIALHPAILRNATTAAIRIKAINWSKDAHRFLKLCANAGNMEAYYTLGMIYFYCLQKRPEGAILMAKAALASHSSSLYSLAIVQFNGSGGTKEDKNLKAGVSLCARAAVSGHIDAIRELGHCVHDGYGISQNVMEGRRLLLEANAREAVRSIMNFEVQLSQMTVDCSNHHLLYNSLSKANHAIQKACMAKLHPTQRLLLQIGGCCLLSDFGCHVPPPHNHIVNQFLVDWFSLHPLPPHLQSCSYQNCGRPETRQHEFRRCAACSCTIYCSRACQAMDWKLWHKYNCSSLIDLEDHEDMDNHLPHDMDDS